MTSQPQEIKKNHVVAMHYTLRDESGTVLDQSEKGAPLPYLHGHGNIVPGLERALTGKKKGDTIKVVVSPADGYGEREEEMVLNVPRSELPAELSPEVGMSIEMETDSGHTVPVRIAEVSDEAVKLDANHELAGVTLHFEVTIDSIRRASEEELAHGHVHGPHGHHH